MDSYHMQLKDTRAQSIFKNLRFQVLLVGMLYTYDIMIYINNGLVDCCPLKRRQRRWNRLRNSEPTCD